VIASARRHRQHAVVATGRADGRQADTGVTARGSTTVPPRFESVVLFGNVTDRIGRHWFPR
jgi:hypothetical protein